MATDIKTKHVKAIIQLRRATEAQWQEANPILRLGEPAYSTDVNKLKIGDGASLWSEIDYLDSVEYSAGAGIVIEDNEISLGDFILDCGTSTTVIEG